MIQLILLLFASFSVQASDLRLKMLLSATGSVDFGEKMRAIGAVEELKATCSKEIALNWVPKSCYSLIEQENKRNLRSQNQFQQRLKSLNQACRQIAKESRSLNQLNTALSSQSLSISCRVAVRKRVDDLEYQQDANSGDVRELDQLLN